MLDIKFIRENPELIKEAARKKHIVFDVAKLLEADDLRLKILREVEDMRARQNAASDKIAKIQNSEERHKAKGFEPKSHIELMQKLDMADFERGAKVAGFRGYFLKNDGALLSYVIWQYGMEFFMKKGGFSKNIL